MKIFKEIFNPWCLARTRVLVKSEENLRENFRCFILYPWKHDTIIHNKLAKEKKARKWRLIEHLINNLRHLEDGQLKFVLLPLKSIYHVY